LAAPTNHLCGGIHCRLLVPVPSDHCLCLSLKCLDLHYQLETQEVSVNTRTIHSAVSSCVPQNTSSLGWSVSRHGGTAPQSPCACTPQGMAYSPSYVPPSPIPPLSLSPPPPEQDL